MVEQASCRELPTEHVLFTWSRHSWLVGVGSLGVVWPRTGKDLPVAGASTTWFGRARSPV